MRASPSRIRSLYPWLPCLSFRCCRLRSQFRVEPGSAGPLAEVELSQLQVARLGNLQINLRTVHHGYRMAGPLDDRGLVGAHKAVRGGLGEGALQNAVAE